MVDKTFYLSCKFILSLFFIHVKIKKENDKSFYQNELLFYAKYGIIVHINTPEVKYYVHNHKRNSQISGSFSKQRIPGFKQQAK